MKPLPGETRAISPVAGGRIFRLRYSPENEACGRWHLVLPPDMTRDWVIEELLPVNGLWGTLFGPSEKWVPRWRVRDDGPRSEEFVHEELAKEAAEAELRAKPPRVFTV